MKSEIDVKKMYHELLFTSLLLNFFDAVLSAIAAFSISYFLIYFYRMSYWVAVGIAGFFFLRSLIFKLKENKILLIEREYPKLQERLRTSYDHQGRSNVIIDSLHKDILGMMRQVDVNAFLDIGKLSFKIVVVCIMLFSVLYFSSVGFDILDLKTRIVNSPFYERIKDISMGLLETPLSGEDRPWLKDPRLLDLGDKELNATIGTYNTELDISVIEEPEKNDFGGHYPAEIAGEAQQAYDEGISEEDKEVIKDYFEKINK